MNQIDFRKLQGKLDNLGVLTSIIRSGSKKTKRYEVIANGSLLKKYKSRESAKKLIIELYLKKH